MKQGISRRGFLASALAGVVVGSAGVAAPPSSSLRPVLRASDFYRRAVPTAADIIRDQKLSGQVAFALAEAKTGCWLECQNEHQGAPPASVTKSITALYALDALGGMHRFETRLIATGGLKDGQVLGDLILVGGGDPTLDTNALAQMAKDLKAAGVIGVKGKFIVYDGYLPDVPSIDSTQPVQVGYNPSITGIALNFNRVHFEWKRNGANYAVTMDARSDRYRPEVGIAVMKVKDRRAPVYTYEDLGDKDHWTVAKGVLGKGGARWLPVRHPALYAGDVFATLARAHGIRLSRAQVIQHLPEGETLVAYRSEPLVVILQGMLKYSTNLTAEMVGLAATRRRIGLVDDLKSSATEMNRWAQKTLGMVAPKLVDHSGLGEDSRVTALDMTKALLAVSETKLRPILKPVVMRDAQGAPMKDHPIKVDAKTGTLNFVSCLAGYITGQDGTEMVFTIFTSNQEERAGIRQEDKERPPGARTWNRRSKRVQQALIERWSTLYAT